MTQTRHPHRLHRLLDWFLHDVLGIFYEMRLSYVPPLMVYLAAGVSGFTGIVESFFVKQSLNLSAAVLADLGFWATLPYTLKMPFAHLVDLFWSKKSLFVYLGALLMTTSLGIMIGLTGHLEQMTRFLPAETWYILSALLSPVGFMMQDVVADAMTVEAVPTTEPDGTPIAEGRLKRMHVTMQTLGRISIIGGGALVAGLGGWLAKTWSYTVMFETALLIPAISVTGVLVGALHKRSLRRSMQRQGVHEQQIREIFREIPSIQPVNWALLMGSGILVTIIVCCGLSDLTFKEEAVFSTTLLVVIFMMSLILKGLSEAKRREIIAIALIVFISRAVPGFGAGSSWWQIDVLGFDEAFFGTLRQASAILVITGIILLRDWMAKNSLAYLIVFCTIYSTLMLVPYIGMYYGLHEWTMTHFGFGPRTIAIIDVMADSPLGQAIMVPMLAWIAKEAPREQKATYFAVMAAFVNLALSCSQLATNYVNRFFVIHRGDYGELGQLMFTVTAIGLILPIGAVLAIQAWQRRGHKIPLQEQGRHTD